MQDIHEIGSGERLFDGGGGDRKLRPQSHQNHQALKCPRCDSLNTKFCYYNNYNLSQPRHYCKSCRRYWTKGGVLRNVPVGGGCRKNKRSKQKSTSSAAEKERKSSSHSSSESSSLTATTMASSTATATATAVVEVASASSSTSALLNFQDSRFFISQSTTAGFDPPLIEQSSDQNAACGGGGIFPELGSFTSMMTSSNDHQQQQQPLLGFNIADISYFRTVTQNQSNNELWQHQQKINTAAVGDDLKMTEMTAGFLDQTAQIELSALQNRTSNGGLAALDWQAGCEQGLFDLTETVDQAYWSQTQWSTDNDHSLNYLP